MFLHRSLVSVQRRAQLGVVSVPATSIQIHALRARGSLDSFTGEGGEGGEGGDDRERIKVR